MIVAVFQFVRNKSLKRQVGLVGYCFGMRERCCFVVFIWFALGKQTFINCNLHLDFFHISFPLVSNKKRLKKLGVEQLPLLH